MKPMALEFAFQIEANVDESIDLGRSRAGHRCVTPIAGGVVRGPKLQGRVLPGGADFESLRTDGCSRVDARYLLRAEDGTPIYVHNQGVFVASPETQAKLEQGEVVSEEDYYYRTTPVFEAPEGPHAWLNDRQFVSRCHFQQNTVWITVFEVL